MLPIWSLKKMKSEKLTVPEYFWARFKGRNKASGRVEEWNHPRCADIKIIQVDAKTLGCDPTWN